MMNSHNRRNFLQTSGALGVGAALGALDHRRLHAAEKGPGVRNAEKIGWRIGVQIYTFHKFTLFEAIDMTASLGLKYIETFWGQRISAQDAGKFGSGISADQRKAVKEKLAGAGLTLTSHYEKLMPQFAPTERCIKN